MNMKAILVFLLLLVLAASGCIGDEETFKNNNVEFQIPENMDAEDGYDYGVHIYPEGASIHEKSVIGVMRKMVPSSHVDHVTKTWVKESRPDGLPIYSTDSEELGNKMTWIILGATEDGKDYDIIQIMQYEPGYTDEYNLVRTTVKPVGKIRK